MVLSCNNLPKLWTTWVYDSNMSIFYTLSFLKGWTREEAGLKKADAKSDIAFIFWD